MCKHVICYLTITFLAMATTGCIGVSKSLDPTTKTFEGQTYNLVFSDEFNGTELDYSIWNHRGSGYIHGGGIQGVLLPKGGSWLDGKGNLVQALYSVEKSELMKELTPEKQKDLEKNPSRWIPVTQRIRTREEMVFGYYEIRLMMPIVPGSGYAYWFQSPRMSNPKYIGLPATPHEAGTEIDVVEQTFFTATGAPNDYKHATIHWNGYGEYHSYYGINVKGSMPDPGEKKSGDKEISEEIIKDFGKDSLKGVVRHTESYVNSSINLRDEKFHTFGVLWTSEGYTFYYDGINIGTIDVAVSHIPQYAILCPRRFVWHQLIGNSEHGLGDLESTKAKYLIDYYRVYMTPEQAALNAAALARLPKQNQDGMMLSSSTAE